MYLDSFQLLKDLYSPFSSFMNTFPSPERKNDVPQSWDSLVSPKYGYSFGVVDTTFVKSLVDICKSYKLIRGKKVMEDTKFLDMIAGIGNYIFEALEQTKDEKKVLLAIGHQNIHPLSFKTRTKVKNALNEKEDKVKFYKITNNALLPIGGEVYVRIFFLLDPKAKKIVLSDMYIKSGEPGNDDKFISQNRMERGITAYLEGNLFYPTQADVTSMEEDNITVSRDLVVQFQEEIAKVLEEKERALAERDALLEEKKRIADQNKYLEQRLGKVGAKIKKLKEEKDFVEDVCDLLETEKAELQKKLDEVLKEKTVEEDRTASYFPEQQEILFSTGEEVSVLPGQLAIDFDKVLDVVEDIVDVVMSDVDMIISGSLTSRPAVRGKLLLPDEGVRTRSRHYGKKTTTRTKNNALYPGLVVTREELRAIRAEQRYVEPVVGEEQSITKEDILVAEEVSTVCEREESPFADIAKDHGEYVENPSVEVSVQEEDVQTTPVVVESIQEHSFQEDKADEIVIAQEQPLADKDALTNEANDLASQSFVLKQNKGNSLGSKKLSDTASKDTDVLLPPPNREIRRFLDKEVTKLFKKAEKKKKQDK